ncbi:hypothetical protein quinque_010236 [Culex quinquefasciatus]
MIFSRLTGSSCNQLIRVPPLPDDPLQLLHLHTVTGKPVSTFFLAYGDHIVENSSMNKTAIVGGFVQQGSQPAGVFFKTLSRSLNNESKLDVTFLDIRSQSKSNWSKKFSARLAPRSDIFFVLWKRHVTDQRPESGPWTVDALREGQ